MTYCVKNLGVVLIKFTLLLNLMSPFINGLPGNLVDLILNFRPSMNVYCPNLQVDYCNLLMIKVM